MTSLFEEIAAEPAADVPVRRVTITVNGDSGRPTSSRACCWPTCSARACS